MKMFLSGLARDLGEHGEHTVEEVRPQGLGHHGEAPAHLGEPLFLGLEFLLAGCADWSVFLQEIA